MKKNNLILIAKNKLTGLFFIISLLALPVLFQNCSVVSPPKASDSSEASFNESAILGEKAMDIIQARCAGCHNPANPEGGISDIADLNYLLFYRLVIPGQPEISDLIRVIKEGTMPPSGNFSNAELEALNEWILKGLIEGETSVTLPGGSAVLEDKFSSIQLKILNSRCVTCHNANRSDGGVDLSDYTAVMREVQAGNPAGSALVTAVERTNNFMPLGGARLTTDEITKIKSWISKGAMNN